MTNNKGEEIERRYLLKEFPSSLETVDNLIINQYYHKNGKRYRSQMSNTLDTKYFEAKKKTISFGTNSEIEKEITELEFLTASLGFKRFIKKNRYLWKNKGLLWEIDRFAPPTNLVIAEVELKKMKKVELPKKLRDVLIMEITGMEEFRNYNLASICKNGK